MSNCLFCKTLLRSFFSITWPCSSVLLRFHSVSCFCTPRDEDICLQCQDVSVNDPLLGDPVAFIRTRKLLVWCKPRKPIQTKTAAIGAFSSSWHVAQVFALERSGENSGSRRSDQRLPTPRSPTHAGRYWTTVSARLHFSPSERGTTACIDCSVAANALLTQTASWTGCRRCVSGGPNSSLCRDLVKPFRAPQIRLIRSVHFNTRLFAENAILRPNFFFFRDFELGQANAVAWNPLWYLN